VRLDAEELRWSVDAHLGRPICANVRARDLNVGVGKVISVAAEDLEGERGVPPRRSARSGIEHDELGRVRVVQVEAQELDRLAGRLLDQSAEDARSNVDGGFRRFRGVA